MSVFGGELNEGSAFQMTIPSLSLSAGSSAGPAVSGGGSPSHTVSKGVNTFIFIGALLLMGVIAYKVGKK
jgi:hypothetical protein